ncbi:MAG: nucleotidyltransferase family protein [Sphingobacteriales bacterium]|nr:nucleotidyltransferase family protein [Sphingobacteriales bacterium]
MEKEYGIIILAAGKSSRLGHPKQSLIYKEETLLSKMVKTAIATNSGAVIVILGSEAELFMKECEDAITVINENWQTGMAGSICCGIDFLLKNFPTIKGTIISVCDQPYVTTELLQQLIDKHTQSNLQIIASDYGGITGTPAFFHHTIFPELMQLTGDKGAKSIIRKDKERVSLVNFPMGKEDIDTDEDYNRLLKNN